MTINPITAKKAPMTPAITQILFLDLQPEIVGGSRTKSLEALTRAAVALARIGKLFSLPMLVSLVPVGEAEPRLVPELETELQGAPRVIRTAMESG